MHPMKKSRFFSAAGAALAVALLALTGLLGSCGENAFTKAAREHEDQYRTIDEDTIQSYLRRNNLTSYKRTDSGLFIADVPGVTNPNPGPPVQAGNQVRVKYIGRYLSSGAANVVRPGTIFDNSADNRTACGCVVFTAGTGTVAGFSEGLLQMRQGDRKLLLIPSRLGYGPSGQATSNGTYAIYPDAVLLFDVEVLQVQQ